MKLSQMIAKKISLANTLATSTKGLKLFVKKTTKSQDNKQTTK